VYIYVKISTGGLYKGQKLAEGWGAAHQAEIGSKKAPHHPLGFAFFALPLPFFFYLH